MIFDNTIVPARVAAATVTMFVKNNNLPLTLSAGNLAAGDTVPILQLRGTVYEPTGFVLDIDEPGKPILSPGIFRLGKDTTVNAVSLHVDGNIRRSEIEIELA